MNNGTNGQGTLSWQEATSICTDHADRLVGSHHTGFDCPFCKGLVIGGYDFTIKAIAEFLREAWHRQRKGAHALSRAYWMHRKPFYSSRGRYDALISFLDNELSVILDRRSRASGRLIKPPHTTMRMVRKYLPNPARQTRQTGRHTSHTIPHPRK